MIPKVRTTHKGRRNTQKNVTAPLPSTGPHHTHPSCITHSMNFFFTFFIFTKINRYITIFSSPYLLFYVTCYNKTFCLLLLKLPRYCILETTPYQLARLLLILSAQPQFSVLKCYECFNQSALLGDVSGFQCSAIAGDAGWYTLCTPVFTLCLQSKFLDVGFLGQRVNVSFSHRVPNFILIGTFPSYFIPTIKLDFSFSTECTFKSVKLRRKKSLNMVLICIYMGKIEHF